VRGGGGSQHFSSTFIIAVLLFASEHRQEHCLVSREHSGAREHQVDHPCSSVSEVRLMSSPRLCVRSVFATSMTGGPLLRNSGDALLLILLLFHGLACARLGTPAIPGDFNSVDRHPRRVFPIEIF
jgi:hypothetical protein